jgi:putative Mg2+ transporter-C (MgtC) family protein
VEPLTDIETFKRLALAMVAGAVLGFERERADKPAGLRTYMLVVEGAALFMLLALLLSQQLFAVGRVSDPGRIASTVIQGIGFIAAGVIITTGREVVGLTTAAGIWVATAIGLLIGAGYYSLAFGATVATVVALLFLREVERRMGWNSSKSARSSDDHAE